MSAVCTVLGPVDADCLGHVQLHEHLICDLSGYLTDGLDEPLTMGNVFAARTDRQHVEDMRLDDIEVAVREVETYLAYGGSTIVDATSGGLGRDPIGLRTIARRSGAHIVMGCGYYVDAFHPDELASRGVDSIAEDMISELTYGVAETGIRAGIIGEIGMSWPPTPGELVVLQAAALAQSHTGVAILVHPGRHREAPLEHVRTIVEAGGDPTRTVMSHVDRTLFAESELLALADTGCVLEFDLFGTETSYYPQDLEVDLPNDGMRVRLIRGLLENGHRDRIVLSQDVCRKTQLTHWGGEGYAHLLRRVLPLMLARGVRGEDIDRMTRETPRRLLTPVGGSSG